MQIRGNTYEHFGSKKWTVGALERHMFCMPLVSLSMEISSVSITFDTYIPRYLLEDFFVVSNYSPSQS